MGMAASQARFLGLTARKSNVEYQGQQINQQRTALANESSNLYNQMLMLDVPTPPSQKDYYKTVYKLDGTGDGYQTGDYEISGLSKTYGQQDEYVITLSRDVSHKQSKIDSFKYVSKVDSHEGTGDAKITTSTYTLKNMNTLSNFQLNYVRNNNGVMPSAYNSENKLENVNPYQIYAIETGKEQPAGYSTCNNSDETVKYFYNDGKTNHFLSEADLNALKADNLDGDDTFEFSREYEYTKSTVTQATGIVETASNGRYASITFNNDEDNGTLKGKQVTLSAVQELDEDGYNEAMNDYEYNKELYEKSIADINAQTESIQKKDQQLELRLEQLDTEQNAISTEMESVQKVIEDNVENTFKVFA